MKRSLAKLLSELKTRPATAEEVKSLVAALLDQERQAKIEALRTRLRKLTA